MSDTIAPVKINSPYSTAKVLPQPGEVKDNNDNDRAHDTPASPSPLNIAPPLGRHEITRIPVLPADLTFFSEKAADYYLHCDRNYFFEKYGQTLDEVEATAPGTTQHQNLARAFHDLRAIAVARGYSLTAIDTPDFSGLTLEENRSIAGIDSAAALVRNVKIFARKYLAADGQRKRDYASIFYHFDKLADKFGLRRRDLDKILAGICRTTKCGLSSHGRIANMAKLSAIRNSAEVGPEGLPREVKELLVKTHYWDLIKNNLRIIVFTTDINSGQSLGRAYPFLRRVEIDFNGQDGKVLAPWEIAGILVHEAAHVSWRTELPILQNATPNERQAFATELAFYNSYEKLFGSTNVNLGFLILSLSAELAVITANQILGYAPDDLSPGKTVLPDPKTELLYYPSNPHPAFLAERSDFDKLVAADPDNDHASADLLWKVLEGRAELDISLPYDYKKDNPMGSPEVVLADQTGRTILTEQQVKRMDKLCRLLLPPSKGSPAAGPYEAFLHLSFRRKAETAETVPSESSGPSLINYQITAVSIRNKLFFYRADLKKLLAR